MKRLIISTAVALAMAAMVAPVMTQAAMTSAQIQSIVQLLQSFGADASTITNVQSTLSGGSGGSTTPPPPPSSTATCEVPPPQGCHYDYGCHAVCSTPPPTNTSNNPTSVPPACRGVVFSRNLTVGSYGADVRCLQVILNAAGYTITTTGGGSPGNETTNFGQLTLAAVRKFQAANGITPANQVGPLTIVKLNASLTSH